MPKPRTGTIEPFADAAGRTYYRAKIRLKDGSRERVDIPEPLCFDDRKARAFASEVQRQEDQLGRLFAKKRGLPLTSSETAREWSARWILTRRSKGHTSTRDDESRLEHHVFHRIGDKPMAAISRADVEHLVAELDAKVQAGDLSWHTAMNVWVVVSRMFRDACRSKLRELRVRDDNPADGVEPPDRGARKAKQFLYPSEFVKLIACERIPLEWRRLFGLAVYLFPRAGELEALEWDDFVLDRLVVHIHRAVDRSRAGETKPTKTDAPRRFSFEPQVAPLLQAMHAESGAVGRITWMPRHRDLAERAFGPISRSRASHGRSSSPRTPHARRSRSTTYARRASPGWRSAATSRYASCSARGTRTSAQPRATSAKRSRSGRASARSSRLSLPY
jgi:integrase